MSWRQQFDLSVKSENGTSEPIAHNLNHYVAALAANHLDITGGGRAAVACRLPDERMALESRFYFWLTTGNADGGSSADAVKGNDCSMDDVRVALHDILI